MLLDNFVTIKWNSKNKKRYVSLGYSFTKMGDAFNVDISDVSNSCVEPVTVRCDYCGKVYKKPWNRYMSENINSEIKKDCCNDCKKYKIIETSRQKYGVDSVLSLDEVKDKVKRTNMEKYGCENVFSSEEIQSKIQSKNIEKYGFKSALMNSDIKEKAKNTCRERYGCDSYAAYYSKTHIKELSPTWKGGVARTRQERSTFEYIQWRKCVFERDHYTCMCCGAMNKSGNEKSTVLNAHHILNWKDNNEKRYDIDNGITLCDECHYEFHSTYGKRNNTEEQIEEFLLNHGKKIC